MSKWRLEAECRGTSSDLFFPSSNTLNAEEKYHVNQQALDICESCTVREECLEYAVGNPALVLRGTWGGKTFKQLKAIRRRRDRDATNLGRYKV